MAFVLKQSDTYVWPVAFDVPVDGGRHERQTFDGLFKRLPQSKFGPMVAELQQLDDLSDLERITEMAADLLVGWSGVTGDDGKEIPFSQKALHQLLEVPFLAVAVLKAYMDSIKGAKRKN
jgi:hypothetical protein